MSVELWIQFSWTHTAWDSENLTIQMWAISCIPTCGNGERKRKCGCCTIHLRYHECRRDDHSGREHFRSQFTMKLTLKGVFLGPSLLLCTCLETSLCTLLTTFIACPTFFHGRPLELRFTEWSKSQTFLTLLSAFTQTFISVAASGSLCGCSLAWTHAYSCLGGQS
jgi:hypothetical protein